MPAYREKQYGRRGLTLALLSFFLIALHISASAQNVGAASKAPGLDARATEKNVQKLLEAYDKDGAYIMKKQIKKGDDIQFWFSGGSRIIDRVDVAVHEETHGYSFAYSSRGKVAFFVGNRKTVQVPITKVYHTKKMAGSVPARLRTFRFSTYVSQPQPGLASNVQGAYGLMNEFMAYRSGMNTMISLYPYFAAQKPGWDVWQPFISGCENNRLAYAEFKYYILHYLHYAKKHYPKVYKGIVNNRQFCRAYRQIESSYVKLIKSYGQCLKKFKKLLEKKGYRVEVNDEYVMIYTSFGSGTGLRRYTADYEMLQKEMKKSKYVSIHKKLVKNGK